VASSIISNYEVKRPIEIPKTFVIFTGVPGSGKSSTSRFLSQRYGFNVVATDSIKAYLLENNRDFVKPDLFHIQAMIFKHLFDNDLNVISDSNSGLSKHRYKLRKYGEKYDYNVVNVYIKCDPEICFQRIIARNSIDDPALIERWRRKIYEAEAQVQAPKNAIIVDGSLNLDEVQFDLLTAFETLFI